MENFPLLRRILTQPKPASKLFSSSSPFALPHTFTHTQTDYGALFSLLIDFIAPINEYRMTYDKKPPRRRRRKENYFCSPFGRGLREFQ